MPAPAPRPQYWDGFPAGCCTNVSKWESKEVEASGVSCSPAAQCLLAMNNMDGESLFAFFAPYFAMRGFDLQYSSKSAFERQDRGVDDADAVTVSRKSFGSDFELVPEASDVLPPRKRISISSEPTRAVAAPLQSVDRVQFSIVLAYAIEGEPTFVIDVLRLGKRDIKASVAYETQSITARPGIKYVHTAGRLEFEPGVSAMQISVPIIDDDSWGATTELNIVLSDPKQCLINERLASVRVKLIDDDFFPSNKYGKYVRTTSEVPGQLPDYIGQQRGQISPLLLFVEYVKLNFRDPAVRQGSVKRILADQIKNLLAVARMYINMLLVDRVLGQQAHGRAESDCMLELFVFVAGLAVPTLVFHIIDYRFNFWKVGGASRLFLQSNLIRKFLAYDPESRRCVSESVLVQATTSNVMEVVHQGYMQVFVIIKGLGEIITICILQFLALGAFGLAPIAVFPICMGLFLWLRTNTTTHYLEALDGRLKHLVADVGRTATCFSLLRDFMKRGAAMSRVDATIKQYNVDFVCSSAVTTNNFYFAKWMGNIVVSVYMLLGGYYLVRQESPSWMGVELTLGVFLTTVKVFQTLGNIFETIYKALISIQSSFPAMSYVITLMNMETEDRCCMLSQRQRVQTGMAEWAKAQKTRGDVDAEVKKFFDHRAIVLAMDMVPILTRNLVVRVTAEHRRVTMGPVSPLSTTLDLSVLQGSIVIIFGESGQGKATFLKTLAGAQNPQSGEVFIPPHLFVLHVMAEPQFLADLNLYDNLTVGAVGDDSNRDRVRKILRKLNLDSVVEHDAVDVNLPPRDWNCEYSGMQRQLLNLARAFVTNPEVLVIHTPLQSFRAGEALQILKIMQEFVAQRGLCADPELTGSRHPRTLFMSTRTWNDAMDTEYVRFLQISIVGGIKTFAAEDFAAWIGENLS